MLRSRLFADVPESAAFTFNYATGVATFEDFEAGTVEEFICPVLPEFARPRVDESVAA